MNSPFQSIWIGYDPREVSAFVVARHSIRRFDRHIPIKGIVLSELQRSGLYYRKMRSVDIGDGKRQLIDDISNAPCSTEFSISRFLVPTLANTGWALYVDCDVMFRKNVNELFAQADEKKAVMVVKHDFQPTKGVKMDGQVQTTYGRKNWSSVILFNCDHPSNKQLGIEYVNSVRGLTLHQFSWLLDDEIGELPPEWNYCVGHSRLDGFREPALVHFTDGVPDMTGYEQQEYADEWLAMKPRAAGAL